MLNTLKGAAGVIKSKGQRKGSTCALRASGSTAGKKTWMDIELA